MTRTNARADIEAFFHPDGVAIVGRIDRKRDVQVVLRELRQRYGTDRVYLVSPSGGSIGDVPVYPSVLELPAPVDLAVLSTPPAATAAVVTECGRKGIGYALVFSSGFSEVGGDGERYEEELRAAAREYGVRVVGPNTNTNAFEVMPEIPGRRGGKIGLLTQSGHQGRPVVQGSQFGIGFSRWVPTGNEADLDVADFMEYFADDDETQVIAGYFEGFRDPVKLRRALAAASRASKPVVALKIGSTEAGRRMAVSHTGHLAGSDAVVNGLFAQNGVTRVRDLDELLDTAALFAKLPAEAGSRLGLYSMSGGSCALMSEVAEAAGLVTPELTPATQQALRAFIPGHLTIRNPVDNGGTFLSDQPPETRRRVLELIADDPNIDVLVVGVTGAVGVMSDNMAADIRAFAERSPVPVVATWNSYKTDEQGFADLVAAGVPLFRSFRNCFGALRGWQDYQVHRARPERTPRDPLQFPVTVTEALHTGGTLGAAAARTVLTGAGLPVLPEHLVVTGPDAAERAPADAPVVMKIASADIPHKSGLGLVVLDVVGPEAARRTFDELMARAEEVAAGARIEGVLVQPQLMGGTEVIVGVVRDHELGHAVAVGMGGVYAELFRDIAVRPVPLDRADAEEMVRSLAGFPLLEGARGRPPADVASLIEVILAVSDFTVAAAGHLVELDLNPVVVLPEGAWVVDSLVVTAQD